MKDFLGLPPDWSATGWQIDQLIVIIHWFMFALFLFWGGYFVYVLVRFRASRQPKAMYEGAKASWSKFLEVGIVLFEIVLLVGLRVPAVVVSAWPAARPRSSRRCVRVVAEQFAWNFHYPGADGVWGRTDPTLIDTAANPLGLDRQDPAAKDDIHTLNNLYLPVDKPALLYLSSKDVIHSFFLPYMRVKHDAVPGQVVPIWFEPVKTGDSEIGCAQLCGMSHFRMRGFLHVQEQAAYDAWLAEQVPAVPPPRPRPLRRAGYAAARAAPSVDVHSLPALNALLNGTSFVLLLIGYALIRRGRRDAHQRVMIAAFACSVLFLTSYLIYHAQVGSVRFQGEGALRTIYLSILLTHTVLAAAVPFLAAITLTRGAARRASIGTRRSRA